MIFGKSLLLDECTKKSYFDRFSKNYFPIKIYQRRNQNERVADHFAEIRLAKF